MQLSRGIHTPCYILDEKELKRSISGFKSAIQNCFLDSIIGYSVKTNSLPYSLCVARDEGCYAEVVSADEYELAFQCGFGKKQIIYNGPMKSHESFIDAITNGAIVNIEAHRELEWLKELPESGHYSVGLRLNVNISKVSPEDAEGENDNSRFGFSDETEDFKSALDIIDDLQNVKLAGLHIHRTAHSRSTRFYRNSIRYACETIHKYGLGLDYLDVGGGFFGIFPNKPTYQDYVDVFKSELAEHNLDRLRIIVEPGNALVASCFSFLTEVIDVKHIEKDCWFITTDGSRNDVDPLFHKAAYISELLTSADGLVVGEQVVSGCTCLEFDRLFTLRNQPLLSVGDRILYKNVGAYTMCLSPLFIRYFPSVYVFDNGEYRIIRSKWTASDYLQQAILK